MKLLALGFLAVLALGVALWWFIHGATTPPTLHAESTATVAENEPAPAPPPQSPHTMGRDGTLALPKRTDTTGPASQPALDPGPPAIPEGSGSGSAKPMPVAQLTVIREATVPTDDMIRDCIKKSGLKPSGTAILTFILAKKHDASGDKIVTETTGVEEDGTTITNPDLIECMHKTAYAMKVPLGEGTRAVFAKRRVVMDNGILSENWVYEWGQIR